MTLGPIVARSDLEVELESESKPPVLKAAWNLGRHSAKVGCIDSRLIWAEGGGSGAVVSARLRTVCYGAHHFVDDVEEAGGRMACGEPVPGGAICGFSPPSHDVLRRGTISSTTKWWRRRELNPRARQTNQPRLHA